MPSRGDLTKQIVIRCCKSIEDNRDLLTQLDKAIGDGDHGINMSRGFVALHHAFEENRHQDFSKLCQTLGMALVMNVGGASGPLFGSMVIEFGKAVDRFPGNAGEVHSMLAAGVDAVKRRGKSDTGAKTMLDVLVPVCDALVAPDVALDDVRARADLSLEKTRDMIATKGRSAFLGERSRGHLDPGAKSVSLLVNAVCDAIEDLS